MDTVLTEILRNALASMQSRGTIHLSTEGEGRINEIRIRRQGNVGMGSKGFVVLVRGESTAPDEDVHKILPKEKVEP